MAESERGRVLRRALEACVLGDVGALPELFTADVSGWSPNMLVSSLDELTEVVADREAALSNVALEVDALDIVGNKGFMEYRLSAVFSGSVRDRRRHRDRPERARDPARGCDGGGVHREQDLGVPELLRRRHPPGADARRLALRLTSRWTARTASSSRTRRTRPTWRCSRSASRLRRSRQPASATSRSSGSSFATTTVGCSRHLGHHLGWVLRAARDVGRRGAERSPAGASARDRGGGRGPAARLQARRVPRLRPARTRRLYERLGYEIVGVVEGCPAGSAARWYRKDL